MTLAKAKAKAKANETFIVQASLTIVTYDHQNICIVQATEGLRGVGKEVHFSNVQLSDQVVWAQRYMK